MRARSARGFRPPAGARVAEAVVVALLFIPPLIPTTAPAVTYAVQTFDENKRSELIQLRDLARRAPAAQREARWFEAALFAILHARSIQSRPAPDAKEVTEVLRQAGDRLPASALAALGARGAHPVVSEAFCKAVLRGGPAGVPTPAEAAAEARDAAHLLTGTAAARPFLDLLRKSVTPAARGSGAVQRSVYGVVLLGDEVDDSTSSASILDRGLRAGIAAAAGDWAGRFLVRTRFGRDDAFGNAATYAAELESDPGVVVVGSGSTTLAAAATLGRSRGFVVVDAREPGDGEAGTLFGFPELIDAATNGWIGALSPELGYRRSLGDGVVEPAAHEAEFRPFLLRPSAAEMGRRLAEAVRADSSIRKIAVAYPTRGGDAHFMGGFLAGIVALRRQFVLLPYEPGRRDFAPEAGRYLESGAQAILFAGNGEEAAEWLGALAALKSRPRVFGTSELDPAGFHERLRGRVEGAVFAGRDWEDRNSELVARLDRETEFGRDPAFRRGYRFGWILGRAVVEGAYSPTSLRIALEQRSHPLPKFQPAHVLIGIDRLGATKPTEVVLPLYVVSNGVAVPFSP